MSQDQVTAFGLVAALGVVGLVLRPWCRSAFWSERSSGVACGGRRPDLRLVARELRPAHFLSGGVLPDQPESGDPDAVCAALARARERHGRGDSGGGRPGRRGPGRSVPQCPLRKQPSSAKPDPEFFAQATTKDFSLTRVMLGYSLPTLAAIGLATLRFCRRDI